ncbi:MAG: carbon monoxide dehydrogenase, partial [Pseudomonadota bacterium]
IIDGFAKKMADQFFNNFQEHVGAPIVAAEADVAEDAPKKGWLKRLVT